MARRAPSAPTSQPAERGLPLFRLVLAAGALAVPGALPWGDLIAQLDPSGPLDGQGGGAAAGILPALFFVVLAAATRLALNYPGRRDVVLLALPAAVAGWALGSPAATLVTAPGAPGAPAAPAAPAKPAESKPERQAETRQERPADRRDDRKDDRPAGRAP
jgi:hypothetical protein